VTESAEEELGCEGVAEAETRWLLAAVFFCVFRLTEIRWLLTGHRMA
jgi:hypothetical protein